MTGIVGVLGELLDVRLRERADHDRVEVAREHGRRVLDRLAAAELEVVRGEVEPGAAELRDADLERDARARRRLLEDHPERPAGEERGAPRARCARLQLVGEVEQQLQLLARSSRATRVKSRPFRCSSDRRPCEAGC